MCPVLKYVQYYARGVCACSGRPKRIASAAARRRHATRRPPTPQRQKRGMTQTLVGRVAAYRRASLREARQRAASRRPTGFETPPVSRDASPAGRRSSTVGGLPRAASPSFPDSSSPLSRRPSRRFSFRFSARAHSDERRQSSSTSEDRPAGFLGAAARVVNLTGHEEHYNGEHGIILAHDVAAGRFLLMLSGGERIGIKPQHLEVLNSALTEDSGADTIDAIRRKQHLSVTEQTDARKQAMASAQLHYESAKLLLGSPCAFRSSSPPSKMLSSEAIDKVPLSSADKDRPPRKQELTPWEVDLVESALQTSPLLRRPQWPPRPPTTQVRQEGDKEQIERSRAPAARRPPRAPPRRSALGEVSLENADANLVMMKEAVELWVDNGMPCDGAVARE